MLYGLNEGNNPRLWERAYIIGEFGYYQVVNINRPISIIVCSVKAGAIDIFFGNPRGRLAPDFHFGQTNKPEWVPYNGAPGEVYIVADGVGMTNLACIMFGGP